MNLKEIKIIEDHFKKKIIKVERKGKCFKIEFTDNSIMTFLKPEDLAKSLEQIHKESIKTLSKCSTKTLKEIAKLCEDNIENEPLVSLYFNRAEELSNLLERAYVEVKGPNVLHLFIKEIDIKVYGKAQTFMKQVTNLYDTIEEVLNSKEKEVSEKRNHLKIVRRSG